MRPRLYIFPCPSSSDRCVWSDTGWMCVFWSYPNMRATTVHPLPSCESSTYTRRLVLIRSPSSLLSLHPHPSCSCFPGQLEEQLRADRASNVPPAFRVMSPLTYMRNHPVYSHLDWMCHTTQRRRQLDRMLLIALMSPSCITSSNLLI